MNMNNYNIDRNSSIIIQHQTQPISIILMLHLYIVYVFDMHLIRSSDCSQRRRTYVTSVSHCIRCTIYVYRQQYEGEKKEQSNRRVYACALSLSLYPSLVHICRRSTQQKMLKRTYIVNVVVGEVVVDIISVENRTPVDRIETSIGVRRKRKAKKNTKIILEKEKKKRRIEKRAG